jgi:hypothetical protein
MHGCQAPPRFLWLREGASHPTLDEPIDRSTTFTLGNSGAALDPAVASSVPPSLLSAYAARAYALMTGPASARPIMPAASSAAFHEYQCWLRGHDISPLAAGSHGGEPSLVSIEDRLIGAGVRPAVVTPSLVSAAPRIRCHIPGWDERNVDALVRFGTKSLLHDLLRRPDVERRLRAAGLLPPGQHVVARPAVAVSTTLLATIESRLDEITALYARHRARMAERMAPWREPRAGVIVRSAWGATDAFCVLADGRRRFELRACGERRLRLTRGALREEVRRIAGKGRQFLVTRLLLDATGERGRVDSPSCALVIGAGWCYAAPLTVQRFAGTKTCGTASLPAAASSGGGRRLAAVVAQLLVEHGARSSMAGVDLMLPGHAERALAQAVQGSPDEDEAIGPLAIAEVNVRPTQRVLHHQMQLAMRRRLDGRAGDDLTWRELIAGYERVGVELHYASHDAVAATDATFARLLGRPELLAGVNGTLEGAYVITPPTGGDASTMAVGAVSSDPNRLRRNLAAIR